MWTSMDVEVDVEVDAEVEVDGDVHVDAEVDVVVDGPGRCPGNFVPPHGGSVCFWGQSSYHDLLLGVHPVRCKKGTRYAFVSWWSGEGEVRVYILACVQKGECLACRDFCCRPLRAHI